MFTLKFIHEDGRSTTTCGKKYSIEKWNTGAKNVIVYDEPHSDAGVEFRISSSSENCAFSVCFITNQSGKTIDRVEPDNID